jgi:uroporphyrinogen decarboxylase
VILSTTPEIARTETVRLLESVRGCAGHIFNLGHGILPSARIECVEAVVEAVTSWK